MQQNATQDQPIGFLHQINDKQPLRYSANQAQARWKTETHVRGFVPHAIQLNPLYQDNITEKHPADDLPALIGLPVVFNEETRTGYLFLCCYPHPNAVEQSLQVSGLPEAA